MIRTIKTNISNQPSTKIMEMGFIRFLDPTYIMIMRRIKIKRRETFIRS